MPELAFDKSVRHFDADGRLHVDISNISKAMVSPYLGSEIPDAEALGLQQDKIYQLLRDPVELEKAASTFRNLPILIQHVPVSAAEPRKDLVVGSTGSDVEFKAPYLTASLSIWDEPAIAGIESKDQAELSSAYRYKADMTPGTYEGVAYDGVMRDIIGNHVALVDVGRAGSDVVVGDSNPFKDIEMKTNQRRLSPKAIAVSGALRAYLAPKIAQDKAIGSLGALLVDVKAATFKNEIKPLAEKVRAHFKDKLAQDADLADLDKVLDALVGDEDELMAGDEDESGDDYEDDPDNPGKRRKKVAAADEDTGADPSGEAKELPSKPEVTKAAMDSAIAAAVKQATANTEALHLARKEVSSLVGEVALDSADAVYKFALDHAGVDTEGVHPSAYRAMVKMIIEQPAKPERIAQDAAASKQATERFPSLKRFAHV